MLSCVYSGKRLLRYHSLTGSKYALLAAVVWFADTGLELGRCDTLITELLGEHFSTLAIALISLMQRGQQQGEIALGTSPLARVRFIGKCQGYYRDCPRFAHHWPWPCGLRSH